MAQGFLGALGQLQQRPTVLAEAQQAQQQALGLRRGVGQEKLRLGLQKIAEQGKIPTQEEALQLVSQFGTPQQQKLASKQDEDRKLKFLDFAMKNFGTEDNFVSFINELAPSFGFEGEFKRRAPVKGFEFNKELGIWDPASGEVKVKAAELDIPATKEKRFDQEKKLRDEFVKIAKPFTVVRDSFARIQASAEDPSAAGDLALIFNYMKVLDPGSTVREGEFANAQNSAGVPEIVRSWYNRIARGERLTVNQRQDFLDRSTRLFEKAESQHNSNVETFKNLAERNKLRSENVVIDLGLVKKETKKETPRTRAKVQIETAEETPTKVSSQKIGRFTIVEVQ